MSKWREVKLEAIGKIVAGGTPSTKFDDYWNGDIGWITPKDLSNYNSKYISRGERNITEEGIKSSSAKLMPKGTILMTSRAPIGYLALANNDISTNQGFKSIICNDEIVCNQFIYYYLKINMEYIKLFSSGATFPEISGSKFKNIKIQIPDLKTQEKIAYILSTYDELIENNNRRIEILEKTAEEIYKEWFVRMRFPGYEKAKFIKGIPEGWEVKRIGDLVNVTSSKRIYSKEYVENGIPFYRSKEVIELSKGNFISTELFIAEERYEEIKDNFGVPQIGDILLTSVGTIGIPMLIKEDDPFYFKDGNLTWIQASSKIEFSSYLYAWICSDFGQQQIKSSTIGTSQSALTITKLNKIKIIIPNEIILTKFNKNITIIQESINNLLKQNQNLIKQRDLLLPRLMNGTIEVK